MALLVPPSRTTWLTANGTLVPEVASSEASPSVDTPLMFWKAPPTITLPPVGVTSTALTPASAVGAHPSVAPVAALNAASRVRVRPLAVLKMPPTYTVELVAEMLLTVASSVGWKDGSSAPVDVSNAATR